MMDALHPSSERPRFGSVTGGSTRVYCRRTEVMVPCSGACCDCTIGGVDGSVNASAQDRGQGSRVMGWERRRNGSNGSRLSH